MRAVIQRVTKASVSMLGNVTAEISSGLLVLVGIEDADTPDDVLWLSRKITGLRLFGDEAGVMNLSISEAAGDMLVVSQFTLMASTKKGNRPSYIRASKPITAIPLYEAMIRQLGDDLGKPVATGTFGADMQVSLVNDGPVTIWIDSKARE